ncbi:MAG: nitroreductase family protein [Bacteroides sp.]|nr:nitroreductase family protein [Bacteroides sp.]
MDFSLTVDHSTCIRCGRCVKVCPASIFSLPDKRAQVELHHKENCIRCGHCAAVCPTFSVKHSLFPPEKIHAIDRDGLPTPEQMMLLIKSRRSNRAFSHKPVPDPWFDLILEAAHRAPTTSNQQEIAFTLVTDPEKLRQIITITADVFSEKIRRVNHPVVGPLLRKFAPHIYTLANRLNALTEMVRNGKDPILRGATSLILIHAPKGSPYGSADSNLAYQNASLMAESLGVSQFYTGFVCRAIDEDKKKRINHLLGIEGEIHAGMAMGMPQFHYPNYMDKEEISVRKM